MYKFIIALFSFCGGVTIMNAQSRSENIQVSDNEITDGYVIKRIPLNHYDKPDIKIIQPQYKAATLSIGNFIVPKTNDVNVLLGKERKKPFAVLYVPAYKNGSNNEIQQLTSFNVIVTEKEYEPIKNAAKTTSQNSVLSTGTWYKISIKEKGIYKIDHNFIKDKLGVDPAGINTANIRVYGNGGTMISENNAITHFSDLQENAIEVVDGGDGKLNSNDYVLFYANGPIDWKLEGEAKSFVHEQNLYEDSSYYFINFDIGPGMRVANQSSAPASNTTVTTFDDYLLHEEELLNIGKYGKEWWGEAFGTDGGLTTSKTFNFNTNNILDSISIKLYLGSAVAGNSFTTTLNGQNLGTQVIGALPYEGVYQFEVPSYKIAFNNPACNLTLRYNSSGSGRGYLNYIELGFRRQLTFSDGFVSFRSKNSVGLNNVASYKVQNPNATMRVWDVTNRLQPLNMSGSISSGVYSFSQDAGELHEFVAFDGSKVLSPVFREKLSNQNLHGNGPQDFLIVTYPDFMEAANKLADFHRQKDNMRVLVATTDQVYNEFNSGSQDIGAIRDFAKYFYDNAGEDSTQMPKYLLLLGDASYDYKDKTSNNTNLVPTYQTRISTDAIYSYCTDDFFSFLDDNENTEDGSIANTMDISVGRIPVNSKDEAMKVIDKIINYTQPSSLGSWRLSTTIMTDWKLREDSHFTDGETMARTINSHSNLYTHTKVHLTAIAPVSTPGGTRAPEANKMINDQVFKGTFLMNYNGHGNINTLADERILTQDDFNSWKNLNKLPIMVTATCDFSKYDDPQAHSAGEKLMVKTDGGAIALLTTTQLVFQGENLQMNMQFLNALFQQYNGIWPTLGDAFKMSKNVTYIGRGRFDNFRKFVLLGDPALTPAFPKYKVVTDSLLDGNTMLTIDSMNALGYYVLKGSVRDVNGNLLNDFNGNVNMTIYDKPRTVSAIRGSVKSFEVQNNIVFKGKATVVNGSFSVSFITPKDLNYDFGKGKISYYVENGVTDGAGTDTGIVVGGFSRNPVVDNKGPQVKPFIDDSLFKDGGITGANTLLYVQLFDAETGVNVSGNGVGHNLSAILDGDLSKPYILNDYYETAPNDFRRGYVNFPVTGLSDGRHNLRVKAWDMNNNSGEGNVNFEVLNGKVMQVQNLMNYPNPFTEQTHFVFNHNHPNEELDITILIYNTTGSLVRTLKQNFTPAGSRSSEITWDGTSDLGAKLPSGVYVYRLNLATEKGIQASAYQKLVLIR